MLLPQYLSKVAIYQRGAILAAGNSPGYVQKPTAR